MQFDTPLTPATLLARYRRFLADVRFCDGRHTTVYCPNTGAMLGCRAPGSRVWLSLATNPRRKYRWTWELVEAAPDTLVGVNTQRSNALVREALEARRIGPLAEYRIMRAEAPLPGGGRIDFILGDADGASYYLEVKNVTAAVENRTALFPDARSERATRHLRALRELRRAGVRAGVLFCVQRSDVDRVCPADEIDPAFGAELRAAAGDGVEVMAMGARVAPAGIELDAPVRVSW